MYKWRYVATVEIDFSFPDEEAIYAPIEKMREQGYYEMTKGLEELIQDDLGKQGTVKVFPQYTDLYKVEDKT